MPEQSILEIRSPGFFLLRGVTERVCLDPLNDLSKTVLDITEWHSRAIPTSKIKPGWRYGDVSDWRRHLHAV